MNSLKTVATAKSYGLQKKKPKTQTKPRAQLSFFGVEDDDEDTTMGDIERVNKEMVKKQLKSGDIQRSNLSAEEAKLYDYDGSYDDFKKAEIPRSQLSERQRDEPKSRYISKIQAVANVREKEKDRIYERRLLKERQVEDAEFGDMPKFVTGAYKKKLMEDRKWEYEDRLADAVERNTTAETRGMHGFLSNLLTKNIAMGADVETSAVSAYTADSTRQRRKMEEEGGIDAGRQKEGDDIETRERSITSKRPHEQISRDQEEEEREDGGDSRIAKSSETSQQQDAGVSDDRTVGVVAADSTTTKPALPATQSISKEDAVKAAKERYLARKMQQN